MKILPAREKRKIRTQKTIHGSGERPRVSVFRSHQGIYVQLIDDVKRVTLVSGNDATIKTKEKNKIKRAFEMGKEVAAKAVAKKIGAVVFDRSGYTYHGRVKALADGLREGGLKF